MFIHIDVHFAYVYVYTTKSMKLEQFHRKTENNGSISKIKAAWSSYCDMNKS